MPEDYGRVIKTVMDLGLRKINNTEDFDIDELFRKATNGDNRTVKIIIHDDKDKDNTLWSSGLCVKEGKILPIVLPKYTVTYKISLSSWYRLVTKQNTFTDLFWSGKLDAEGEFFARDIAVWKKFWDAYADNVVLSYLEKKILRPKD
jgi:hypothetical protein